MGIKVILATGIDKEQAKEIALECGILQPEHQHICGAVMEGRVLRKIYNGQQHETEF